MNRCIVCSDDTLRQHREPGRETAVTGAPRRRCVMVNWYFISNTTDGLSRSCCAVICFVTFALGGCTQLFEEAFWTRNQETKKLMEMVEAGDASAQTALGQRYELGNGVQRNRAKAKKWYRRAVEQGDPLAMFLLGQMFETGAPNAPSNIRAANLYISAANKGNAAAQARLAQLYEQGRGVPQDFAAAAAWYTKAAQQWEVSERYPLGATYAIGRGDRTNSSEAIRWFERAAALGVAEAQFDLGRAYELGNGVKQNLETSLNWYQEAAQQDHDRAVDALLRLRGAITDAAHLTEDVTGPTLPMPVSPNIELSSMTLDRGSPNSQSSRNGADERRVFGTVFMAHLASYQKIKQAEAGWDQLLIDHHAALRSVRMEISKIILPRKGAFYRIEAGPFSTLNKAKALCSVLEARRAYCQPLKRNQ